MATRAVESGPREAARGRERFAEVLLEACAELEAGGQKKKIGRLLEELRPIMKAFVPLELDDELEALGTEGDLELAKRFRDPDEMEGWLDERYGKKDGGSADEEGGSSGTSTTGSQSSLGAEGDEAAAVAEEAEQRNESDHPLEAAGTADTGGDACPEIGRRKGPEEAKLSTAGPKPGEDRVPAQEHQSGKRDAGSPAPGPGQRPGLLGSRRRLELPGE